MSVSVDDSPSDLKLTANEAVQSVEIACRREDRETMRSDQVAVEAPLEIWIGGKAATVMMRTPGHDEDLVRGFLFAEGIITRLSDIASMGRPIILPEDQKGNVIAVELANRRKKNAPAIDREFFSNSSCGVCGKKTIASLAVKAIPSTSEIRVQPEVLNGLPETLRTAQSLFAMTGGAHASALFNTAGELIALREDVGRHNALDKLIGWALTEGMVPLTESVLLLSGRISYELVQKAAVSSIPIIAAVGAPSSLAVQLAQQFNITLIGFLRRDGMNVYANGERINRIDCEKN